MQYINSHQYSNCLSFVGIPSQFLPVDYNSIAPLLITHKSINTKQEPMKIETTTIVDICDSMQSQLLPPPPMIERQSKTNVYIKGLPENFNDDNLESLVPDRSRIKSLKTALEDDMRCKGYGFIDFLTEDDARNALIFIQGNNPTYNAKFAKENEKDKTNIYVTNIPKEWSSKDSDKLKVFFERFGPIQSAFIMLEKSTNKTVGVGFVRFVHEVHALKCLETIQTGEEYFPDCDRPIEAKFADKHNPETRKRRNPSTQVDHLTSGRSINVASLFNHNIQLGNNLCGIYNSPFVIRNQNLLPSPVPQVPLLASSTSDPSSLVDLATLYNLGPQQMSYLYQNQLIGMPNCYDLCGANINPLLLANGIPGQAFTHNSGSLNNPGLELLNYAQMNHAYANAVNMANYSPSVPYSKNSNAYFNHSNSSID